MKRHVWLPVSWTISFLMGVAFAAFGVWSFGAAFIESPSRDLPAFLAGALFFMAPLFMEARVASRCGMGPVRVLTPWGRFNSAVEGTWLDVGWDTSRKYVVWHTPNKKVRLAWTITHAGAIRQAVRISSILDIPHRVDPAVHIAAEVEANGKRTGLILMVVILVIPLLAAVAFQVFLMLR